MKNNNGFTLIELMIVVAIIGILTMFASTAYSDYTKRTYVAEALNLVTPLKIAMVEYYATQGKPALLTDELPEYKGKTISLPGHSGGVLTATSKAMIGYRLYLGNIYIYFNDYFMAKAPVTKNPGGQPRELVIIPEYLDGSTKWYCGEAAAKKFGYSFTWENFKVSTIVGQNDIPRHYLPANCR